MRRVDWVSILVAAGSLVFGSSAWAQTRPYIGFVYPAGGQQGTTFQIKLGGQGLDAVDQVLVTGQGVTGRVLEYNRTLGAQEITLLNEQLRDLRRAKTNLAAAKSDSGASMMMSEMQMTSGSASDGKEALTAEGRATSKPPIQTNHEATAKLITRLEKRVSETVNRPASVALASIVYIEVTIDKDAAPGQRELRLATPRGISNPLVFHVGQLPEVRRKPMVTAPLQVLGKEELALRRRPSAEVEERITVPCVLNGQVASGEINRYRFSARKGQNLVFTTLARQLIPYIADAVPGWFQPVLALHNAKGKEVAYDDDFRFKPDPTFCYPVPEDGEYVLGVYDAIYRGREDFVYRIMVGEVPFVTSLFPLGGRARETPVIKPKGWNLDASTLAHLRSDAAPGVYPLCVTRDGFVSNPLPFALDSLPEAIDKELNNTSSRAQKVSLPIIINGRMDRKNDWDLFQFRGKSNETVAVEVYARRLDSPLDSILKLTDATGKLLAFNDDREDLGSGLNTHHADSYLLTRLPADGTYFVHIGDTAGNAGEESSYRLRISAPQPDFSLRVVPSSVSLRSKGNATLNVHLIRRDGFTGPIKLALQNPPPGFSANPVSLSGTQTVARLNLKTDLATTQEPVNLSVVGSAKAGDREIVREAVPAEDRMQAFLWRHLVPAAELKAMVYDPAYQPPPKRIARPRPPAGESTRPDAKPAVASADPSANKPRFTKQQVAGRLRQLKLLFEDGLLTDDFYDQKVAECEAVP